jgi:hypothetical protein
VLIPGTKNQILTIGEVGAYSVQVMKEVPKRVGPDRNGYNRGDK